MTNEQKSTISRMLDKGMSYAEISKQLQLPYNSVKSFCRRHSGVVEVRSYESRCKHCGEIIACTGGHRQREFCSNACRYAWWHNHPERRNKEAVYSFVCACCRRSFQAYGNAKRKYCSHRCYIAGRYKGGDEEVETGV